MTKTQRALEIIRHSAEAGMSAQTAARAAETETGLRVFAEPPLVPKTAGPAYYESHAREQKRARFIILASGKADRVLADEFVAGFRE
jgi:hypothetical protein